MVLGVFWELLGTAKTYDSVQYILQKSVFRGSPVPRHLSMVPLKRLGVSGGVRGCFFGAFFQFSPGIHVFSVFTENHHINIIRVLHRRRNSFEPSDWSYTSVKVIIIHFLFRLYINSNNIYKDLETLRYFTYLMYAMSRPFYTVTQYIKMDNTSWAYSTGIFTNSVVDVCNLV